MKKRYENSSPSKIQKDLTTYGKPDYYSPLSGYKSYSTSKSFHDTCFIKFFRYISYEHIASIHLREPQYSKKELE